MSLDKFITAVKTRGLARTNRYEVRIPRLTGSSGQKELVTLMCDAANLPGKTIATTAHRMFGEVTEMPYDRAFDPVQLSFYVDSKFDVRRAFEDWMNEVINQNRRTVNYYNTYIRDVEIVVYNVDSSSPYTVTLYECFPKSISTVSLSAESKDVMKLQVTLQYRYWKSTISRAERTLPVAQTFTPQQDPQSVSTGTGFDGRTLMELEYGIRPDGSSV